MLPDAPSQTDGQSRFMAAAEDANSVWQKLNADPDTASPVTLIGGYDQATLDTDVSNLRGAYTTLTTAENDVRFIREQRNDLQDQLYGMLKSYRQVLPTFFAKDHALVESLPRLTPLPGSTPDPVTATGVWFDNNQSAKITWTESTDANLERYEVRFVAGPVYSSEDETLSGSFLPGDPLEHITSDGLSGPGATASYKVYVILTTGNEKGSNAVSVTWPFV